MVDSEMAHVILHSVMSNINRPHPNLPDEEQHRKAHERVLRYMQSVQPEIAANYGGAYVAAQGCL